MRNLICDVCKDPERDATSYTVNQQPIQAEVPYPQAMMMGLGTSSAAAPYPRTVELCSTCYGKVRKAYQDFLDECLFSP